MKKFKIGDKVKVIIDKDALPQASIHTVTDIYWRWRHEREYVHLNGDNRDSENGWDINRFELYKEKEQPVKIDMNKKYRRVGTHEPVRVICVDRKDSTMPCVGLYNIGTSEGVCYFDHQGYHGGVKVIEEITLVDWSKVEVDTLIWVNNTPRYFAEYSDNGLVFFFANGTTSKTNNNSVGYVLAEHCSLEEPK